MFRTRRAALQALRTLADEHGLCLRALGLEAAARGACFRHQVGRCAGVCAGKENVLAHHLRAALALSPLKSPDWPYPGKVAIVETDATRDATEVHVVDRWCYLGAARDDAEVSELIAAEPRFDYDHYRILARHVGRPGVRVRSLAA